MSDAPEQIWIMPTRNPKTNCFDPDWAKGDWHASQAKSPLCKSYTRTDLIPQWQSMDSAPKDGTRVLLSTPWGVCVGEYHEGSPQSHCGRAVTYDGWYSHDGETQPGHNMGEESDAQQQCPPTHWMPLPPLPSD